MNMMKYLKDESGAALLMAILFTLIVNGIALTLFATASAEISSSGSQVLAADCFSVAEAGINIGLLRIKALMEANDPIDPSVPFMRPPFNLTSEGGASDETLGIDEYRFYDLVALREIDDTTLSTIRSEYSDTTLQTFSAPIEGFFMPETSNPDAFQTYLSGAEPVYSGLVDTGESTLLRGWRVYLMNDNDHDDKTALLVSVGYLLDPANNLLYQKKIELNVYIHGMDMGKNPDPTGQVTSSERGARTGRFRVTSDLEQPVSSYDLR